MATRTSSRPGVVCLLGLLCLASCGASEDGGSTAHGGDVVEAPSVAPQRDAAPHVPPQAEPSADEEQTEASGGPPDLSGWRVGAGHRGVHTLAWRPAGRNDVPRNEEFEIEVLVLRDGQPLPGMRLAVTGWMPEHEHGLVRLPLIEELGDGRYLVSGMLMHMRGSWQLRFQIFAGRDTEIVTFDQEL